MGPPTTIVSASTPPDRVSDEALELRESFGSSGGMVEAFASSARAGAAENRSVDCIKGMADELRGVGCVKICVNAGLSQGRV